MLCNIYLIKVSNWLKWRGKTEMTSAETRCCFAQTNCVSLLWLLNGYTISAWYCYFVLRKMFKYNGASNYYAIIIPWWAHYNCRSKCTNFGETHHICSKASIIVLNQVAETFALFSLLRHKLTKKNEWICFILCEKLEKIDVVAVERVECRPIIMRNRKQ